MGEQAVVALDRSTVSCGPIRSPSSRALTSSRSHPGSQAPSARWRPAQSRSTASASSMPPRTASWRWNTCISTRGCRPSVSRPPGVDEVRVGVPAVAKPLDREVEGRRVESDHPDDHLYGAAVDRPGRPGDVGGALGARKTIAAAISSTSARRPIGRFSPAAAKAFSRDSIPASSCDWSSRPPSSIHISDAVGPGRRRSRAPSRVAVGEAAARASSAALATELGHCAEGRLPAVDATFDPTPPARRHPRSPPASPATAPSRSAPRPRTSPPRAPCRDRASARCRRC